MKNEPIWIDEKPAPKFRLRGITWILFKKNGDIALSPFQDGDTCSINLPDWQRKLHQEWTDRLVALKET